MTRQGKLLMGGLIAIALTALAFHYASKFEPYEHTTTLGPSPEARADRYLAAVRFLESLRVTAQRVDDLRPLDTLESQGHSLLLLGDRSRLSPGQTEQLLDWAERGGHLLFVAEALWDEDEASSGDLLLDRLGIQQHETDAADEPPAEAVEQTEQSERSKLYLPGERAPAQMDFDVAFHLYDPEQKAYLWANSAEATHLLQFAHGQGRVTVLTDAELWTNSQIGKHDHAWLLWYLTQDTEVTLVGRSDHPSLANLLASNFPQALLALTLLLALALWRAWQRQGPLLPAREHGRRQLQGHVRSLANFHLRHDGRAGLIARLQSEIRQRAGMRQPGFAELTEEAQHLLLSRLSLLPRSSIDQAMRLPADRLSNADFTDQVARLQTLRNAL